MACGTGRVPGGSSTADGELRGMRARLWQKSVLAVPMLMLLLLAPRLAEARSVPAVTGGGTLANGDQLNVNAVRKGDGSVRGKVLHVAATGERRAGRVTCVKVVERRGYVEAVDSAGATFAVVVEDGGQMDRAGAVPGALSAATCDSAPLLSAAASQAVTRGNFTVR